MSKASSPTSPATPTSANTCCRKRRIRLARLTGCLTKAVAGRGRMRLFPMLAGAALAPVVPAAAAAVHVAAQAAPQKDDWKRIARQDVLAAYDLYAENHPGMRDPTNPGFAAQLAHARD